jgi:hypothetical protein
MQSFVFDIDNDPYKVEDKELYYLVTFPDLHSERLFPYLDESQETAFRFENRLNEELAGKIGEEIIRNTM